MKAIKAINAWQAPRGMHVVHFGRSMRSWPSELCRWVSCRDLFDGQAHVIWSRLLFFVKAASHHGASPPCKVRAWLSAHWLLRSSRYHVTVSAVLFSVTSTLMVPRSELLLHHIPLAMLSTNVLYTEIPHKAL